MEVQDTTDLLMSEYQAHIEENRSKESTPEGGGFGITPKRGLFALPPEEARKLSPYLSYINSSWRSLAS